MIELKTKRRPARNASKLGLRGGRGQTMILTVMMLTGAILSATAISALLVLFQLRQASDIKASTQAIFAADSGVECIFYQKIIVEPTTGAADYASCEGEFTNGSSYRVEWNETATNFKSVGRSGRTARTFGVEF